MTEVLRLRMCSARVQRWRVLETIQREVVVVLEMSFEPEPKKWSRTSMLECRG